MSNYDVFGYSTPVVGLMNNYKNFKLSQSEPDPILMKAYSEAKGIQDVPAPAPVSNIPKVSTSPVALPELPINKTLLSMVNSEDGLSMPPEIAKNYYENVSTPTSVSAPAGIQDIPGAVSKAYKSAGGGWKGAGLATLAGLGKLGEFMGTKTGNQIMAGLADNPYLAQGYLNNANTAREEELGRNKMAFEMNQEKLKNMGEDVRANEQRLGQQKVAAMQLMAENQKALSQMSQQERFHAIDTSLKEQGINIDKEKLSEMVDEFDAKQTQEANEISFKNRSLVSKLGGMVGIGNELKSSTIGNAAETKTIGGQKFEKINGEWHYAR